jgi:hypothetical protein
MWLGIGYNDGVFECGDEISSSIECGEFLDQLSDIIS